MVFWIVNREAMMNHMAEFKIIRILPINKVNEFVKKIIKKRGLKYSFVRQLVNPRTQHGKHRTMHIQARNNVPP